MIERVAAVQMNSIDDREHNLRTAGALIDRAAADGARLIALPENFSFLGPPAALRAHAEPIPGPSTELVAERARHLGVHILAGSVLERDGSDIYNTSVIFDPSGTEVERYRKVHLFDVAIGDHVVFRESDTVTAGERLVVADSPIGPLGLTVCFDLRFPELFRSLALKGARAIVCPAAFTLYTGKDHWEVLLRARAIENQVYVIAPAQIGRYSSEDVSFGGSMIIDPWGTVIARASEREGAVVASIDDEWQDEVRASIPAFAARRPQLYED